MHNKLSMTALAGVLALTTSGSDHGRTIQPSPIAFFPKKLDLATSLKSVPKPQNTSQKPDLSPPGLIASTNVDQRLKNVQLGRPDPFTGMFPQIEIAPPPPPAQVFPDLPKLPAFKAPPAPTVKATPPNTKLAQSVAVEGVVQVGDKPYAIIKLPSDRTSRYVSEGQELAGGRLLVKKIAISPDSDSQVIFEQNGIEISLAVDEPVNSESTDESTDIASSAGAPSDSLTGNSETSNSDANEPADSEETEESTDTVASSGGAQNSDSLTDDSDTSDSDTSDLEAAELVEATQPTEEYTAAIPVSSPPPKNSSLKKLAHVVVSPAPTNYKPPVDIASVGEAHPNQTVLSPSDEILVASDRASSDRAGQDQVVVSPYASSEAESVNQPQFTSANALTPTDRQQLISRLRQSSTAAVENSTESNSIPSLQANVDGTPKQQLINQLRSEKPLSTSNELLTQKDSRVLLHRQQLINQLRSAKSISTHE